MYEKIKAAITKHTLKSIANNTGIDVIWEEKQPAVEKTLRDLNAALRGQGTPFEVETGGRAGQKIDFTAADGDQLIEVKINGVDVFHPQSGEVHATGPEGIATWFIDTDYNEESFFIRNAYFLGTGDPYKSLKSTLKDESDREAWVSLYSDTSRPFPKPTSGRIAVKVINHLGDEVMKVFRVDKRYAIASREEDYIGCDSIRLRRQSGGNHQRELPSL